MSAQVTDLFYLSISNVECCYVYDVFASNFGLDLSSIPTRKLGQDQKALLVYSSEEQCDLNKLFELKT